MPLKMLNYKFEDRGTTKQILTTKMPKRITRHNVISVYKCGGVRIKHISPSGDTVYWNGQQELEKKNNLSKQNSVKHEEVLYPLLSFLLRSCRRCS